MNLRVLCAGAAQGLVDALQDDFGAQTGARVDATFGAVGMLAEKLAAGERCDAVVLTAAMIANLETGGQVLPGTNTPLGRVRTGIAVRAGDIVPAIADARELRATLLAASGICVPDIERATAGIHFAKVLRSLGIHDAVAPRLRLYPNGATAMRALAGSTETGQIGCTQITEIRYTRGVTLVGALPPGFELATVYASGVCTEARMPDLARRFAAMLSGPGAQALRESCGFE